MSRPPLAEALDLQPHPEGGWFRETYRSSTVFQPDGYDGPRSAATAIYYLLEPGDESRWHIVASDELWLWHSGGALELSRGGSGEQPGANPERVVLGAHDTYQVIVPAGEWQAAKPVGDEAVLVSCIVVPGFDFTDFKLLS